MEKQELIEKTAKLVFDFECEIDMVWETEKFHIIEHLKGMNTNTLKQIYNDLLKLKQNENLNIKSENIKPKYFEGVSYQSNKTPTTENFKNEVDELVGGFEISRAGKRLFIKLMNELIDQGKIKTWKEFGGYGDGIVLMINPEPYTASDEPSMN